MSHRELYDQVARLAKAMKEEGIEPGDRVAGFMPNMPETVIAMLATAALGAIWSSCSPDFGHQGVLDRFGQIEPKVLFVPDGYYYAGKTHPVLDRVKAFAAELQTVQRIVVCPLLGDGSEPVSFDERSVVERLPATGPGGEIDFFRQHSMRRSTSCIPLATGKPKCIVRRRTLIQHLKNIACSDRNPATGCSTSPPAAGDVELAGFSPGQQCTLLLYDLAPTTACLFDYARNKATAAPRP